MKLALVNHFKEAFATSVKIFKIHVLKATHKTIGPPRSFCATDLIALTHLSVFLLYFMMID